MARQSAMQRSQTNRHKAQIQPGAPPSFVNYPKTPNTFFSSIHNGIRNLVGVGRRRKGWTGRVRSKSCLCANRKHTLYIKPRVCCQFCNVWNHYQSRSNYYRKRNNGLYRNNNNKKSKFLDIYFLLFLPFFLLLHSPFSSCFGSQGWQFFCGGGGVLW